MARVAVAAAVVLALAAGVWALWPDGEPAPSTTLPVAASTTTEAPTTTAPPRSTTSTTVADHVVETVEEAEAILRELWFEWFEGIYEQDEDRLRAVVLTEEQVAEGVAQFGVMPLSQRPTSDAFSFTGTEVLLSTSDCLGIWASMSATFREGSSEGVHVLRLHDGSWKLINYWVHRGDLWENDCDAVLP